MPCSSPVATCLSLLLSSGGAPSVTTSSEPITYASPVITIERIHPGTHLLLHPTTGGVTLAIGAPTIPPHAGVTPVLLTGASPGIALVISVDH